MNERSVTSTALHGDYETSDRIAARNLDRIGITQVKAREKTPSACPHIEHLICVERCSDKLHRLWLDGSGGLPRAGRPAVAWPTSGFETAERAVREARGILNRT